MKQITDGIAISYGAEINLYVDFHFPSLRNNMDVHSSIESVAKEVFPFGVFESDPSLGGEDFAFYSDKVPSMFYFIGAKDTQEPTYFLHNPKVVFNEGCIQYGVDFLTKSALKLLS